MLEEGSIQEESSSQMMAMEAANVEYHSRAIVALSKV
jgi:hypothetical protein